MKKAYLLFKTLFILLILTSCSNDDDKIEPDDSTDDRTIITEESLINLHDNTNKRWRITGYYSSYKDLELDMNFTNCMKDDMYTFYVNDRYSDIELGNEVCYNNYPNEISGAAYTYYPESQSLYLDFTVGGYSNLYSTLESIVTKCILLTEEKMIFTNGGEDNPGAGLVFEKVN